MVKEPSVRTDADVTNWWVMTRTRSSRPCPPGSHSARQKEQEALLHARLGLRSGCRLNSRGAVSEILREPGHPQGFGARLSLLAPEKPGAVCSGFHLRAGMPLLPPRPGGPFCFPSGYF